MIKKAIFTVSFLALVGAAAWSAHMVTAPDMKPPQDPVAQARVLMGEGKQDQAINLLKESLKSGAKDESLFLLLADMYLAKNELEPAKAHYTQALNLNHQSAKAFVGLGLIDLRQGQVNTAVQKFTLAMKADPTTADPYYQMGNLALGSNKADMALNFYKRALEIDKNHQPTLTVLAQINKKLAQMGKGPLAPAAAAK